MELTLVVSNVLIKVDGRFLSLTISAFEAGDEEMAVFDADIRGGEMEGAHFAELNE